MASSVVKQKGEDKLVRDSKSSVTFDVEDDSGPAHPRNTNHKRRIQPLKCTAEAINRHAIDFIKSDNQEDFYETMRPNLKTHDLNTSNDTFRNMNSSSGFTKYTGSPGFRLRHQNQKIMWNAFAYMQIVSVP